ncbi:MAG: hypothetical protein PHU27_05520 [Salinivirgaceae bacterium]|nr:hypothetical protein [Salinivirgaceae bacterium]
MKHLLILQILLLLNLTIIAQNPTLTFQVGNNEEAFCHTDKITDNQSISYSNVSVLTPQTNTKEVSASTLQQITSDQPEPTYRRSSLYPILLETDPVFKEQDEVELQRLVMESYTKAPFPEKYNDHRLNEVNFRFKDYVSLSPEELAELGDEGDEGDEKKGRKKDEKYIAASERFLKEKNIAKGMVAKWFNRKADGTFDMSLIHERGSYDASAMSVQLASGSIRGMSILQDAGEELIKNTFVVINRMRFVKNEPIARAIRDIAYVTASQIKNELAQNLTVNAANIAYNLAKDGYSVWTVSYLYQLEWNDDLANNFYENMWMDESNISEERKHLFETTDIFKLNFIGFEKSKSLVLLGAGKSKEEIIEVATIRNIDRTYVKLQKAYDVFKTKTPIVSTNPIVAKIGMKEGVESGDKFEVLEMVVDKKTGLTKYATVGQIKVNKKQIWDNRYALSPADIDNPEQAKLNGTAFKGSKKIMAGMLIRQVK